MIVMSFWHGRPWSRLERAAARSFVQNGYTYKVCSYIPVKNLPTEVENVDAREYWDVDQSKIYPHKDLGSIGPFSDLFRYKLLSHIDGALVVDTDQFCLRPYPDTSYLFGRQNDVFIANGVMRIPSTSKLMIDTLSRAERFFHTYYTAPWASTGPRLLTDAINDNDMFYRALPTKSFYPISPKIKLVSFLRRSSSWIIDSFLEDSRVYGLQMWSSGVRYESNKLGLGIDFNRPEKGSFYEKLVLFYDA